MQEEAAYLESRPGEHLSRVCDMSGLVDLLEVEFFGEVAEPDLREKGMIEVQEL